jgi:hypothetical protein
MYDALEAAWLVHCAQILTELAHITADKKSQEALALTAAVLLHRAATIEPLEGVTHEP